MNNVNFIWGKYIPLINKISLILYLVPLFTVDLYIVIRMPGLFVLWFVMFIVLGIFLFFYRLENTKYRNRFTTFSSYDKYIFVLIILRNILFLLNFIPYIQIFGFIGLVSVGAIIVVIYLILIGLRNQSI